MTRLELPVTDAELAEEYQAGASVYKLADKYDCSKHPIEDRLKSTGCKLRGHKIILPITDIKLKEEYETGLNTYQLADKYRCDAGTINSRLKSVDCKMRGREIVLPVTDIKLKEEYKAGLNIYQLADKYGYGATLIYDRLKSVDCEMRDRKLALLVTDIKLKEEYKTGLNTHQLADKYGCCVPTINRRLKSVGCRIRQPIDFKDQNGVKNSGWNGGSSFEPYCPKFNESFKESIRNKFDRKCFICGITEKEMQEDQRRRGKRIFKLSVHHVNYNKDCLCDDSDCEFVPLCSHHHVKTNTNREYWESSIMQKLNDLSNNDDGLRAPHIP
jgi:Mor family transcriptional regulator